jgi:aspartate/methionine/tyrosine aminotransferase
MTFSERSGLALERDDAVEDVIARRLVRGDEVFDLTVAGASGAPSPSRAAEAALAEALAGDGLHVPAHRLVLTASVGSAFDLALTLLTDPGDEVLVPEPGTALDSLAQLAGVALAPYPLASPFEGGQPDPLALWEAVGPRTRAVVAAHPGATGAYLSTDVLEALAALEVPCIIDETAYDHRLDLEVTPARVGSDTSLLLTVGALGDVTWMAVQGPAELADEAAHRVRALASTRGGAPDALHALAPSKLARAHELRDAARAHAREALELVRAMTAGTALEVPPVEGGLFAPLRLRHATVSSDAAARVAAERGVRVRSGASLGFPDDEAWIAIALLTPLDVLRHGLQRMVEALV